MSSLYAIVVSWLLFRGEGAIQAFGLNDNIFYHMGVGRRNVNFDLVNIFLRIEISCQLRQIFECNKKKLYYLLYFPNPHLKVSIPWPRLFRPAPPKLLSYGNCYENVSKFCYWRRWFWRQTTAQGRNSGGGGQVTIPTPSLIFLFNHRSNFLNFALKNKAQIIPLILVTLLSYTLQFFSYRFIDGFQWNFTWRTHFFCSLWEIF